MTRSRTALCTSEVYPVKTHGCLLCTVMQSSARLKQDQRDKVRAREAEKALCKCGFLSESDRQAHKSSDRGRHNILSQREREDQRTEGKAASICAVHRGKRKWPGRSCLDSGDLDGTLAKSSVSLGSVSSVLQQTLGSRGKAVSA